MTSHKQAIIVPYGTGTAINPLDIAQVNVPAMPWADGSPILPDDRPETAPARGVMSSAQKAPAVADLFIAALREARDAMRREREA